MASLRHSHHHGLGSIPTQGIWSGNWPKKKKETFPQEVDSPQLLMSLRLFLLPKGQNTNYMQREFAQKKKLLCKRLTVPSLASCISGNQILSKCILTLWFSTWCSSLNFVQALGNPKIRPGITHFERKCPLKWEEIYEAKSIDFCQKSPVEAHEF